MRDDPKADNLARILDAGIVVPARFVDGFDEDAAEIFAEQLKLIDDNNIGQAALSTRFALPKTPLQDRLAAEGRLRPDDPMCYFEPLQMSRDALVPGSTTTRAAWAASIVSARSHSIS